MINKLFQFMMLNRVSLSIFLLVGALSAVVNFAAFFVCWNMMGMHYEIAVSIAYVLSVIFHFFANRRFSFKGHNVNALAQLPKYLVMLSINYIATLAIVHIVVEQFHFSPYIGIVCAIACTMWVGFILLRFWVFSTSV